MGGLLSGGFASPNEVEQKTAESESKEAELLSTRAKLTRASLEVNDCILRAPFDGEIATRNMDPGAFARPGTALVSMVDRRTVRVTADVPEVDFGVVAPNTPVVVRSMAMNSTLKGAISRRAPTADYSTRTVHFEVDLSDPNRAMPVGTTAEVEIDVGVPVPATRIPLTAATVRGSTASVFVADQGVAHAAKYAIQGERGGALYLDPALKPGTMLVTEGRALLKDKDPVQVKVAEVAQDEPPAPAAGQTALATPESRQARDP
jgi:RND family efflux transporter MFP subunit